MLSFENWQAACQSILAQCLRQKLAKVWRLVRLCLHLSRMLQAVKWMVPLFLMLNRRGAAC